MPGAGKCIMAMLKECRPPAALVLLVLSVLIAPGVVSAAPLAHAAISSPNASVYNGQSTNLTATWSGGVPQYTLSWYTGTAQNCGLDTTLVQRVTGLVSTSNTITVTPPPGGAYYCITVTDSGSPPASDSSYAFGVVVMGPAPPSTTSVQTTSTVPQAATSSLSTVVTSTVPPPVISVPSTAATTTVPVALVSNSSFSLCDIVNAVRSIVGILALALFLLGGVLYAVSHFLPTNIDFKKSLTAWAVAMIVGGIIGLVIVLLAQPLIILIIGVGNTAGSGVSSVMC